MSRRIVVIGVQAALMLALMASLGTMACSRGGGEEARRYPLEGQVLSVEAETATARVAHEDIPGFMPAMTMNFDVVSEQLLDGIEPGMQVSFQLERSATMLRISALEVTVD